MSTGIELEWERKAIRGDELPDDLGYPEQVLYLELRMLYEQYRNKIIDRDAATREKKRLLDEYRIYSYQEKMEKEWVEIIRLTELYRAEFRKNPSIETAWKLVNVIEGRKTEPRSAERWSIECAECGGVADA